MADFTIDGSNLIARLERITEQYETDAKQLINQATAEGTAIAKANARVDTGLLRNSIMPTPAMRTGDGYEGSFGTGIYYAGWQNYGFTLHGGWHEGTHYMELGKTRAEQIINGRGRVLLDHIKQQR